MAETGCVYCFGVVYDVQSISLVPSVAVAKIRLCVSDIAFDLCFLLCLASL